MTCWRLFKQLQGLTKSTLNIESRACLPLMPVVEVELLSRLESVSNAFTLIAGVSIRSDPNCRYVLLKAVKLAALLPANLGPTLQML